MNCENLLKQLNDYVDGDIDPEVCEQYEAHMEDCNPCQVVVDNIRKTITLYKAGTPYVIPLEFRRRLHETLRQRWAEKMGVK